jgi:hypothetical protein
LYDECRRNPKNACATNKSSYYVKKRGHDAHYNDNRCLSSGDKYPSKCETPVPSGGEVDDKLSDGNGSASASNYHLETSYKTQKKRRLVEPTDVGHKSPAGKNRKSLVEPDSGMKEKCSKKQISPKKLRSSKSDGDLLNFYDDDVMSDDGASCLSIPDDNGAFGFAN